MPAKTHGMSRTRIYYMWKNMKGRCTRESCDRWSRYGGRGIKVEEPWFSSFISFYEWAIVNGYQEHLTIDRIDEDGNYCPGNCQFITSEENTSKSNKKHIENKTGGHSVVANLKTKQTNRKVLGVRCKLIKPDGSSVECKSIGEAAEYLVGITGRKFSSVYSQLKQIVKGKCKTLLGHTLEVV